ncbi:MAG TPA: sulfotransferase [Tepidisphaeraceae bacterium]|nr:sulfotransferase [Tepidisphaeraceae bacterium]
MYFNTRLFFKAEYLALFGSPFRIRRWAYVIFFTDLFALMWMIVAVGRILDSIFFPGFRRQKVREPVFIIAPPRSGTTLTQKLMCLDAERFVHAKMYQTILPCVCYQRLLEKLAVLDRRCGWPVWKVIARAEKRWFGGWDHMHRMRLDAPEEDDGFFVYSFVTEAVFLLFPFVNELWEAGFADALPRKERAKLMAYYRSCLQRQLYGNGERKTILSKATQSCGAVRCLLEAFPDAKFITIIRHPYESVASHVSVFYPVWQAHSPEIERDSAVSRAYARLAVEWYRHLYRMRGCINPKQYYCIDYRNLVRNPCQAIEQVYEHFGFAMSDAFRAQLVAATAKQRQFKSTHEYTLEEFGLSKEWIQQELREVLDAYGLER